MRDLIIVVNGNLDQQGTNIFSEFTEEILIRPNVGFDAGGWQEAICNYCGFERLREYDELLLCNDSFFGPLYPFTEVFEEMVSRDVDFWGLTVHGETPGDGTNPFGYRPRYIQTYFMVFRSSLLNSSSFSEFWSNLPIFLTFEQLAEQFSSVMTKTFADAGFRWGAFSDTTDLESTDQRKNFDHHSFNLYELISERRYPVLKRRSFLIPKTVYLRYRNSFDLQKALSVIREISDYDVRLITDHLLRKQDPAELKECLNLNFVLPKEKSLFSAGIATKKCAVVVHLYYPDLFAYSIRYLTRIPDSMDLFISVDSSDKEREITEMLKMASVRNRVIVRVVNPRGREWSALLVAFKDLLTEYDYWCFVHDKKSSQKEFSTVGSAFFDALWENTLASNFYIRNVIQLFETMPELGLLTPPPPYWGTYFKTSFDFWTICYEQTQVLAERLGLSCNMKRAVSPIALGSVFWCRTNALKPLLEPDWQIEDFDPEPLPNDGALNHALERILPYVAASQGFLSGWILSDDYARVYLADLQYMVDAVKQKTSQYDSLNISTFERYINGLEKKTTKQSLVIFIKRVVKGVMPELLQSMYRNYVQKSNPHKRASHGNS